MSGKKLRSKLDKAHREIFRAIESLGWYKDSIVGYMMTINEDQQILIQVLFEQDCPAEIIEQVQEKAEELGFMFTAAYG